MVQKMTLGGLLKTVLILSILSGCGCLPKAPDIKPKQLLQRYGVCNQYKLEFKNKLLFKFEKEIPIEECLIDGHFILTDNEIVELRRTYEEAKKCYEDTRRRRCK